MGSGIYSAMSGAVAQQVALDVTANNVANAQTFGFRAERVAFGEALTLADRRQVALVTARSGSTDLRPGALVETGDPLDLALVGDGYFTIETERGPRYTRAGNFRLDDNGRIVTADGHPARAVGGGALVVPPEAKEVQVAADGTVSADGHEVGALAIVSVLPQALSREAAGLFVANVPAEPAADVEVLAGTLEGSNYPVVRGMVDLVRISRTYESLHRMLETYRDLDARTARDVGNPG